MFAKRRDANEREIVDALRQAGAYVFRLHGPLDLLVGFKRRTYLIEAKTAKGRLKKSQQMFLMMWPGGATAVVRTAEEALAAIGAIEVSEG